MFFKRIIFVFFFAFFSAPVLGQKDSVNIDREMFKKVIKIEKVGI